MTKVLLENPFLRALVLILLFLGASLERPADGQNPSDKPAEALYLQLGQVGLDPSRVYAVRGASIDRSAAHFTLEDGTIERIKNHGSEWSVLNPLPKGF